MKKKNIKILLIIGIILTIIAGFTATYSFFLYQKDGNVIDIEAGEISIDFLSNKNYLNIPDAYPVSDTVGKIYPYYTDFTITGVTDVNPIKYEIQIVPNDENTLNSNYIKVYLTDQEDNPIQASVDYREPKVLGSLKDNDKHNGKIVYYDYMVGNRQSSTTYLKQTTTRSYRLRVWIDENYVKNLQENFGFSVYLHAYNDNNVKNLYDVLNTSLSSLLLATDGTDRIVTGSSEVVNNNYIMYSGKLWRVVSLGDNETVKVISNDIIESRAWGNNSTYNNSSIYNWLNGDFKNSLYNYDSILKSDYNWNATLTTEVTKPASTTMVSGAVGLLSAYEYASSYSTATPETGYLNNGNIWWNINPYNASNIRRVNANGSLGYATYSTSLGVRPSIVIKENSQITGGTGTIDDPYRLVSDAVSPYNNEGMRLADYILMTDTNANDAEVAKAKIRAKNKINLNNIAPFNAEDTSSGMYMQEDDYGESYFYRGRGSDLNNNVYFGGHYWKVIRINGDGSIRLIYNGATVGATGDAQSIGRKQYNLSYWDPTYVGYMYGENFTLKTTPSAETTYNNLTDGAVYYFADDYGFDEVAKRFYLKGNITSGTVVGTENEDGSITYPYTNHPYTCRTTSATGKCVYLLKVNSTISATSVKAQYISYSSISYDGTRTNEKNSNVKTELDKWYKNTFIGNDKVDTNGRKLTEYIVDGSFCNDRDTNYSGYLLNSLTYYRGYNRATSGTVTATLKCNDIRDTFSTTTERGNGRLTYPIGLITSDEVVLAGLKWGGANANANNYLRTGGHFWTMTPSHFDSALGFASAIYVYSRGYLNNVNVNNTSLGARPVINLSSETLISSGIGTTADPFILTLS